MANNPQAAPPKLSKDITKLVVILVLIFGVFMMLSIFSGGHGAGTGGELGLLPTGKEAPDFTVTDLDGNTLHLSDLRGKVVFLNFWATWCAPCRRELPSIQSLYKKYLNEDKFAIVAVSGDVDGPKVVADTMKKYEVNFPVYLDPQNEVIAQYGVEGFPETFLIDRDGKVVHKFVGPREWHDPRFREIIDQLLAE